MSADKIRVLDFVRHLEARRRAKLVSLYKDYEYLSNKYHASHNPPKFQDYMKAIEDMIVVVSLGRNIARLSGRRYGQE